MPRTWTDEEKEEQRQRMLALHAEGRAGGEFGKLGGRPRKKRPQEQMAERAKDEGDRLYDRLISIVDNGRDAASIQAVKTILEVVENERKIEVEEEQRFAELNSRQLRELVSGQLLELLRRRVIEQPGTFVEGTARELGPGADGASEE